MPLGEGRVLGSAGTEQNCPLPQCHRAMTVLVSKDRGGQAQTPSTLPTHTANEPLAHLPASFSQRHRN